MKSFLVLSVLLGASTALAAGGDPNDIPWAFITKQVIHFLGFGLILAWIINKVKGVFAEREKEFVALMKKAETAKAEAEALKKDFSSKLANLEATRQQTIDQAHKEAASIKDKIMADAKEVSDRVIADAMNTAQYEVEKAKNQLRQELLTEAVDAAEKALKEKRNSAEMEKLDKHFVEKIQVVQ